MAGRLAGKVALVTGTGSGIGQGCARILAREGALVVGCDISGDKAEATLAGIKDEGGSADSIHPVDLTKVADARRVADLAAERHGRIDILVNAAAIAPHMERAAEMDYENQWTPTMVGEVDIVFLVTQAVWPHMVRTGGGSIVNFASVNAQRGSTNFGMVAHCAGKGAVMAMTRQLAIEGGPHGIRVNSISPGLVRTDATAAAGATQEGGAQAAILDRLIIKRLGRPQDIAYCVAYLASDEAEWVTGANFNIDGGVMAA